MNIVKTIAGFCSAVFFASAILGASREVPPVVIGLFAIAGLICGVIAVVVQEEGHD